MQTICSIHNTVLSCVSPSSYSSFVTGLKDFAPLGASAFSLFIAGAAFWVALSQKKINANAYRLNLFKERFAAYKKFQERYKIRPNDLMSLQTNMENGYYPDQDYLPSLEEVYLLFDKDLSVKEAIDIIKYLKKNNVVKVKNICYLLECVESEIKNFEKDIYNDNNISKKFKDTLVSLHDYGLFMFPVENSIMKEHYFYNGQALYRKKFGGRYPSLISHDELVSLKKNFSKRVKYAQNIYKRTFTKEYCIQAEGIISLMIDEKRFLDTIKEMMECKLSLPSNPTDE